MFLHYQLLLLCHLLQGTWSIVMSTSINQFKKELYNHFKTSPHI